MKFLRRVRSLFRKEALETEMTEEMRHHVELQTALNLKAGMNAEDARYAAQRQFGNVAVISVAPRRTGRERGGKRGPGGPASRLRPPACRRA